MAEPMIIKVENQKINLITEENPIILKQTGQGMPGRDGAFPVWGNITGNISDQTDLQNALDAKADSADLGALATKDTADFYDDISNKPAGYPPSPHNHDDRYYTEGETDTMMAGKADAVHNHDDRYYTETEMDAKLNDKADIILSSASGSVVTISDGAPLPVSALSIGIEAVQSGSGDPAPDNVRPITGWSTAHIYLEDEYDAGADPKITIALGDTRYGGTLNVLTGELTVTHAIIDLGTLEWEKGEGTGGVYVFQAVVSDKALGVTNMICSDYAVTTVAAWNSSKPNNSICGSASNRRFVVRDTRYSTASAFTTAVSGVKAVYELDTPTTVQLTENQLSTLKGGNVLWADCGSTSLTYRADTKLYSERRLDERTTATQEMLTTVTDAMLAPKNLTAGDLVIANDTLYRATANIASGATMTVGTNVVKTSIEEVTAPLYGVCDSSSSTVAKTVSIPNFVLRTGVTIYVKFTNSNGATAPTLNVSGTGAYPMYRYGTTGVGSTSASNGWQAGSVLALTFDGVGWIEHLWQNTTYTLYGAYCTTSASTAEKTATCTYFALRECWFEITVRYANTKKDALTLNVASTGALPIYINGTISSSSNYTLPAGQYIVYCDGTKYYFRTDGKIEGLCEEAPKDGNAYVRKDGAWVNINSL